MRPLPERLPDVDRRVVTRIPPDPYVRVDTLRLLARPAPRRQQGRASASRSAKSSRLRSTPVSLSANTVARSPGTARSPRSSTREPCVSCAAPRPSPRSSSGRSPATTS